MYKQSKYKNEPIIVNGIKFPSKLEANFYKYLTDLLERSIIDTLELQVKFVLMRGRIIADNSKKQGFRKIRDITYRCDFLINKEIVMDAKGMRTPVFNMKEKMFTNKYYDQYGEIVVLKNLKQLKEYCIDKGWI